MRLQPEPTGPNYMPTYTLSIDVLVFGLCKRLDYGLDPLGIDINISRAGMFGLFEPIKGMDGKMTMAGEQ